MRVPTETAGAAAAATAPATPAKPATIYGDRLRTFAEVAGQRLPRTLVGGKAHQLAALAGMGLRYATVPDGAVVTTEAYEEAVGTLPLPVDEMLDAMGGLSNEALAQVREAVKALAVPADVLAGIRAFLANVATSLGVADPATVSFAVRSSGAAEDGADASFAGQYESVLNVRGVDAIAAAIARVWASQFNDHVLPYLRSHGGGSSAAATAAARASGRVIVRDVVLPSMAVVIMLQVPSTASGVMFTLDPTAAGESHALIESVWGQGEGLVSGEFSPQSVTVDWARYLSQLTRGAIKLPAALAGTAVSAGAGAGAGAGATAGDADVEPVPSDAIVKQSHMPQPLQYLCAASGELEKVATTAELQAEGPLTRLPLLLHALTLTGLQIAMTQGRPQDVEWCTHGGRLFIVQTRPVTSYAFRPTIGTWHMVLAYASAVLDESLLGDAYRLFTQRRFPLAPLAFSQANVTFRACHPVPHDHHDHHVDTVAAATTAAGEAHEAAAPTPAAASAALAAAMPPWIRTVAAAVGAVAPAPTPAAAAPTAAARPIKTTSVGVVTVPALPVLTADGTIPRFDQLSEHTPQLAFNDLVLHVLAPMTVASAAAAAAALRGKLPPTAHATAGAQRHAIVAVVDRPTTLPLLETLARDVGATVAIALITRTAASAIPPASWHRSIHEVTTVVAPLYPELASLLQVHPSTGVPQARPADELVLLADVAAQWHSRVIHGRTYKNESVQMMASAVRYALTPAACEAVIADAHAFTDHFDAELAAALEHDNSVPVYAQFPLASIGKPPTLSECGDAELTRKLTLYRDACSGSWSSVYLVETCEAQFNEALEEVKPVLDALGINSGTLLTGITSRNALDQLEALAQRHSRNAWLIGLATNEAVSDAAFVDALRAGARAGADADAAGVLADVYRYLVHYGWNSEHDEDLASEHWAEDASFPLTILRRSLVTIAHSPAAAAPPAPPAAAASAASGAGARGGTAAAAPAAAPPAQPPWLSTASSGGGSSTSSGSAGGAPRPPPHAPLLRRLSSVASDSAYQAARAKIADFVPADSPLWQALEDLRVALRIKEKVHIQYVKLGLNLKLHTLAWLKARWADIVAADGVGGGIGHATPLALTPSDYFQVPYERWLATLRGQATLADLTAAARAGAADKAQWRSAKQVYYISAGKKGVTVAEDRRPAVAAATDGSLPELSGLACSAGAEGEPITGVARVVESLQEAVSVVKPGDILVTRITSPAWTPLFSIIRGVILEEGGALAHGAVVAREVGIPAVVQVYNATSLLRSGDTVVLDGQGGTVTVIARA